MASLYNDVHQDPASPIENLQRYSLKVMPCALIFALKLIYCLCLYFLSCSKKLNKTKQNKTTQQFILRRDSAIIKLAVDARLAASFASSSVKTGETCALLVPSSTDTHSPIN